MAKVWVCCLLLLTLFRVPCGGAEDTCTDVNGKTDTDKGWTHINKLNGYRKKLSDHKLNSTYEIGICVNLLPDDPDAYAGVLEVTHDNKSIIVGRYNESEIIFGDHWILLKYLNGDPYEGICANSSRHAAIMFVCNQEMETLDKSRIVDENLGRSKNCYHLFEIEHCVACISDGCRGFFYIFSPGSIILICTSSLVVIYLLVGWLYTRCVKREQGWRQLPHAKLWQEIGHLQADGCDMVCRCGTRPEDEYRIIAGDSGADNPNNLMSEDESMLPP